ncbi:MAG TPA: ATP-binding protein [Thermodesulfovibrionales bacterium]|nr:ATP-binding protein [Thermodesulfovibrionales bacterium]
MKGYILIIGVLAIIVSALVTLNIFFQQSLQLEVAEQFNKQQLLLSRSIADNIKSYIGSMKDEVTKLAYELSKQDVVTQATFDAVVDQELKHARMVRANIGVLGKGGEVIFFRGDEEVIEPYYQEIAREGKAAGWQDVRLVNTPSMVTIVSPIQRPGRSDRVVFISFTVSDVGSRFFKGIKSGMRGYAWMMDDRGYLLFHPTQPGMVGRNLYKTDRSCFTCHKSFEVEKKIIEGKQENYGIYVAPSGEDKVLAYSSLSVGLSKWIVAVSAPYSEVTRSIQRSMKLYSWLIIAIFATTSVVSGMLIVFYRKRLKAEEIEHHQKLYAGNLEKEVAKRTEELTSEKEKLNTIVTAIGSGIVLMDTEGRIKWINQAMKDMAGRDVTGANCEEICSDCSIISSYVVNDLQTEIMSNLFGRKDKYFQITTAPVKGEDGELHGYIRLVQDVTEMKKMEEQMMHSEKLASLGRLTAGIAHEIGNPLTSVFSFVQILKEMEDDEFKKESLGTIYFHINRVAEILKQLSGFSKMPAVELKSWNVNDLIESSLSLIQYDKRAKEITIARDLSPELPEITTDGGQLSQVFVNLILNAVDAMPGGGTLTIRSTMDNGNIIISFEDTGVGIPREHITRIFDPFFTTKEKGTGLGLAVSYSIIKKLNSSLTVESEVSKGTKFSIALPVNGKV